MCPIASGSQFVSRGILRSCVLGVGSGGPEEIASFAVTLLLLNLKVFLASFLSSGLYALAAQPASKNCSRRVNKTPDLDLEWWGVSLMSLDRV